MKTPLYRIKNTLFGCITALTLLFIAQGTFAQTTTSYNLNSVPVTGSASVAIGSWALTSNSGSSNTAVGYEAMYSNTSASQNAAFGTHALKSNQTGSNNTAIGFLSMNAGNGGHQNTAVGSMSLNANTGTGNCALGYRALYTNTSGGNNVAIGHYALNSNTTAGDNTAIGRIALTNNTTGAFNSAMGTGAMSTNTSGNYNAAFGHNALAGNTNGTGGAALGIQSLVSNTTGTYNTGLGYSANVSTGALTNATAVGSSAVVNASNKVRLGSSTVTKVEGPVAYTVSDGRFKTDVREDDVKGLDFIQRLRPVVYNFETRAFTEFLTQDMPDSVRKHYLAGDFGPSTAIRQSGFIAQEVEQAAKEAGYNFNGVSAPSHAGDNYSLAYGQFVVPIVKGMQEQQAMIEKQQAQIAVQTAQIAELQTLVHKLSQGTAIASDKAPTTTAELAQPIQVFPNPSHGRFTLRIAPEWTGVLEVYDMRGRSVMRQTLLPGNPEYQLDLTAQPKGSYLLQLDGRDGTHLTEKLIIE